ncbi:MAG: type II secretion system protein GspC [Gammaproteobacteria bacterium]
MLKPALIPQSLPKHIATLISLVLVVFCAHALAKLTWMLLPQDASLTAPPVQSPMSQQPMQNPRNIAAQLASAHLFGQAEKNTVNTPQVATETRLNLVLRGVLAADSPQYAIAIISSGKNGKEEIYGIDDTLPGNARLREVHAEHVLLLRNGQLEILKLTKDAGLELASSSRSDNSIASASSPAEALGIIRKTIMRNPTSFGDFALPVVVKENGKQIGYRLQPQAKGRELLGQIGLESSDIITSINGIRLDNPQNGIGALRKLSTASNLNITVKRNGNEVPLNIQLQ